jgi:hypothetical protein
VATIVANVATERIWLDTTALNATFPSRQFSNAIFLSPKFPGASIKEEEEEFLRVLQSRAAAGEGKIEVTDINKVKSMVEVKELITLSKLIEDLKKQFPGLVRN